MYAEFLTILRALYSFTKGGLSKPPKFALFFVPVITFPPFLLCK